MPLTYFAASLRKNRITSATSSGSPIRPRGETPEGLKAEEEFEAAAAAAIGVAMVPGATALTSTPYGPISTAMMPVSTCTAALLAE